MGSKSVQHKILVVDDDPAICNLIARFFSYNNYQIQTADNAKKARDIFYKFNPDLAILDVNLPDESGFKLCQEIRQTGTLVLMLTCMVDTQYVLEGFAKGADDYLTKPFNLEILKAKVAALFKRQTIVETVNHRSPKRITIGGLVIDQERCEVKLNEEIILLTALEFALLSFLARNPHRAWERSELIEAVWSQEQDLDGVDRKVDVHIGQIRKKIGDVEGKIIKTVRGKGYRFEETPREGGEKL
jgi:DNA-binding response OmpR family regulator